MVKTCSKAIILMWVVSSVPLFAHRYSAGFRWSFISWGISGRYFHTPNFYIQGNGIFGYKNNYDNDKWEAYSVGGSLGYFFFVNEWVRPFIGIEVGTGTSQIRNYRHYDKTTKFGGRFLLGVAISALNFLLGSKEIKGLSGLTLELETGILYLRKDKSWWNWWKGYEEKTRDKFFWFPDFGVGIYYNW